MGRSHRAMMALIGIFAAFCAWFAPGPRPHSLPEPRPSYLGRTAAAWDGEIENWEPLLSGWGNKTGRWTWWVRSDSLGDPGGSAKMPLLCGDPAAVPVLTELLTSRSPKTRLLAAEGLEVVGEPSRGSTPALIRLLDDPDEEVRGQAEQTLFQVDPEAAVSAGVRRTMWEGITRR